MIWQHRDHFNCSKIRFKADSGRFNLDFETISAYSQSMRELTNLDDKFFKSIMSNKKMAQELMVNYLPKELTQIINTERIEILKDSFVSNDLRERFSDIVYQVEFSGKAGYVYFLFEHKSYQDQYAALQMLEYMIKLWRLHLKQHPGEPLPIILPVLFYHGEKEWKYGRKLSEVIEISDEKVQKYFPDYEYVMIDVHRMSDEAIKGYGVFDAVLLMLKHLRHRDQFLRKHLERIFRILGASVFESEAGELLRSIYWYLLERLPGESEGGISLDELLEILNETKGGEIMTLAEELRRSGWEKGQLEGRQEGQYMGELKNGRDWVIDMLKVRFGLIPEDILSHVQQIENLAVLKKLHTLAIQTENLEGFRKELLHSSGN